MSAGERYVQFKLGNRFGLMMAPFLLIFLGDGLGSSARREGLNVFGVPFSPFFLLLFVTVLLLSCLNGWLLLTKLRVGEGWVEVPRPWGARRVSLQGTKIVRPRSFPITLLVEPNGRRRWLALPSDGDSYGNEGLLCLKSLIEGGARYEGQSWDRLKDGRRARSFAPNATTANQFIFALTLTAFFMHLPVLLKPPITVSWLILSLGPLTAVSYLVLVIRPAVLKETPINGVILEDQSIALLKEGKEKWKAPISSLRVETSYLWKPEMARVRVWSGEEELSVPGTEGMIPGELLWALVELGVPWTLGEELRWWEWSKV